VDEGKRLRKIFVQTKLAGGSACDLRNLDGVGQATAKVVGGAARKNLRLSSQAAEGTSLHNPLAITLEGRARRADRCRMDASQKKIAGISGDRAPMEIECHSQVSV
jgi:hypothetical protein